MKLNYKVPIRILERPYMQGSFVGVIIGIGIDKILSNALWRYNLGIISGVIILLIGLGLWLKFFNKEVS